MNTLLNKKELALCKEIALCEMVIDSTKRITNPRKQAQVQRVIAKWQARLDKAREQAKAL
jgi:hypothetical protein